MHFITQISEIFFIIRLIKENIKIKSSKSVKKVFNKKTEQKKF